MTDTTAYYALQATPLLAGYACLTAAARHYHRPTVYAAGPAYTWAGASLVALSILIAAAGHR